MIFNIIGMLIVFALSAADPAVADSDTKGHAIVLGGSCERNPSRNQAHRIMSRQIKSLRQRGWNVDPLYDGDTARCKQTSEFPECREKNPPSDCCKSDYQAQNWHVSQLPGKAAQKNTKQNLLDQLDRMINMSNSGAQTGGKKLFISINTHGNLDHERHAICMEDGWMDIHDPELHSRLKKLKADGWQMGFSSLACFGGEAVKAFKEYGCAMTSTTKEQIAQGDGINASLAEILENPRRAQFAESNDRIGISMDEVFLYTLLTDTQRRNKKDRYITQQAQLSAAQSLAVDEGVNTWMTYASPPNQSDPFATMGRPLDSPERCRALENLGLGIDELLKGMEPIINASQAQKNTMQRLLSNLQAAAPLASNALPTVNEVVQKLRTERSKIKKYLADYQQALNDKNQALEKLTAFKLDLPLPESLDLNDSVTVKKIQDIFRDAAVYGSIDSSSLVLDRASRNIVITIKNSELLDVIKSDPSVTAVARLEEKLREKFSDFAKGSSSDFYLQKYLSAMNTYQKDNQSTLSQLSDAVDFLNTYDNRIFQKLDQSVAAARAYLYLLKRNQLKFSPKVLTTDEQKALQSIEACERFTF